MILIEYAKFLLFNQMAVIPPAAPVVQEDDYSPPVEMSRPPIALEQQNAQHAFVKLLQRGIQTAEGQLNLHSMCLTLQEERSLYGLIKHKLLSTANNTLQRRNNMSSSLGASNAGSCQLSLTLSAMKVIHSFT